MAVSGRQTLLVPVDRSGRVCIRRCLIVYGLQKERAFVVHLPKPTATMLVMTRQT